MKNRNPYIFTFESVIFLSDCDLLRLLKEIDNVTLLQACNRCDNLLIYRITSQFSRTARDCFYEDMTKFGIVKDEDVFLAQERIGVILNGLSQCGKLKDWNTKYAS